MEQHQRGESMKILVNLSNLLLSEALHQLIKEREPDAEIFLVDRIATPGDVEPDMILVDAGRLDQELFRDWPQSKVILVDTGLDDQEMAGLLVYYNLDGVIATNTDAELFTKALRVISRGELWLDQRKVKSLMHSNGPIARKGTFETLSEKEKRIIALVARGYKNREIADQLYLSEQTIKAHVSRIYKKLKVSNRSQLVSLVMKHPLIKTPAD